jgi:hypothetical protein
MRRRPRPMTRRGIRPPGCRCRRQRRGRSSSPSPVAHGSRSWLRGSCCLSPIQLTGRALSSNLRLSSPTATSCGGCTTSCEMLSWRPSATPCLSSCSVRRTRHAAGRTAVIVTPTTSARAGAAGTSKAAVVAAAVTRAVHRHRGGACSATYSISRLGTSFTTTALVGRSSPCSSGARGALSKPACPRWSGCTARASARRSATRSARGRTAATKRRPPASARCSASSAGGAQQTLDRPPASWTR